MQTGDPRGGSICLPSGPNWWRLFLTVLALFGGAFAGIEFHKTFDEVTEAIVVGLTTTEILFHVMDVVENLLRVTAAELLPRVRGSAGRALLAVRRVMRRARDRFRDFMDRYFGGSGGGFAAIVWRAAW
ncbi:hypothetical protein [Streptomyces sp. NPDC046939]|uniref:hypothetical protein n=1 Tax=Streptomyces sp. NPDC046939 TaxID=3155376 RepID=UPI0033F7EF18